MNKASMIFGVCVAFFFCVGSALALDYRLMCLNDGQELRLSLCNPNMDDYRCHSTQCQICTFLKSDGVYCSAHPGNCNALGLTCSFLSGSGSIDEEPPVINILAPDQGEIFHSRTVQLSIDLNEQGSISMIDNLDPRAKWKPLCSNCNSYSGSRGFNEGLNDIGIRAMDKAENEAYANIIFRIDSKKPKMGSVTPTEGFSSGLLGVSFEEANPVSLSVHYGNSVKGMRSQSLNVESDCELVGKNYRCEKQVNLADFDRESVEFWFEITDIAGNNAASKHSTVQVKITPPVIQRIEHSSNGKNVMLHIEIDEPFLEEVSYVDMNEPNGKEKSLCTSLKSGACDKKTTLNDGEHDLKITVRDKAGNTAEQNIQFFTDSKVPKITKTEPKTGFAAGAFGVIFEESNPTSVKLFYSTPLTGEHSKDVSLSSDCVVEKNKYDCATSANLGEYNGEQLTYWFAVGDRAGTETLSKKVKLPVDTVFPVISDVTYTLKKRVATVVLNITEQNFLEVRYVNDNDARGTERKLCSSLKKGACSGKITLYPGMNNIDFIVEDKAGNAIAHGISIEVE